MKLKNLFARSSQPKDPGTPGSRETDSFANGVLFEIKAVVGSAIAQALQDKEGRYMRSILQESHFTLQAVSIKALDNDSARQMDDFISAHEAIDPGFRQQFFRQVLQREYRSAGGAKVQVASDLMPVIELDRQTLEPQTEDESYLVSLKGRRVRFEAHVVLEGPVKNAVAGRPLDAPTRFASTAFGRLASSAIPNLSAGAPPSGGRSDPKPARTQAQAAPKIRITVHDRTGLRTQQFALPVVLGRELSLPSEVAQGMEINATFASRRQLVIFELLGQVYCFVPRSASLSFSTHLQQVLRPDCLEPLMAGGVLSLTGGVPTDTLIPPPDRHSASDYPKLELELLDGHGTTDATPRPRAV